MPLTSFSPLQIGTADTPPKPEKELTPGRELTREERKLARRRNPNGAAEALPNYVGKRLTFTLPSASAAAHTKPSSPLSKYSSTAASLQHSLSLHSNSSDLAPSQDHHPIQSEPLPLATSLPIPALKKSVNGSPPSQPPPQPPSQGRDVLGRVKVFGDGFIKPTSLLPLQSPSKLLAPGQSSQPKASESRQTKPSSLSFSNESRPSSSKLDQLPENTTTTSSDGVLKPEDIPITRKKYNKKSQPVTRRIKSVKQIDSKILHTSSKKRKVSPSNRESPDGLKDVIYEEPNIDEQDRRARKPVNKPASATLVSKPLQETDLNLPDDPATQRRAKASNCRNKEGESKTRSIPLPVFPSDKLIFQPFEAPDSAVTVAPTQARDDRPITGTQAPKRPEPSVASSQIVVQRQKQSVRLPSTESHATPTVLNSPPDSPQSSSSSGSVKMKSLAAKIFSTPGPDLKSRASKIKGKPRIDLDHNHELQSLKPFSANPKGKEKEGRGQKEKNDQQGSGKEDRDEGEDEIYIIADRLVREEDAAELDGPSGTGESMSAETQKLKLKIRSQLNPPDIISITYRNLIQEEITKLERVLAARREGPHQDGQLAKLEAEKSRLENLLRAFRNTMLEYSDQLVQFGILKLQLQSLSRKNPPLKNRN